MALIKCPECKKKISDTVTVCPQCGYSITPKIVRNIEKGNVIKRSVGLGVFISILILIGFFLYSYLTLKPNLVFGNKCKNLVITNETYTFSSYDNFYYSLDTFKPIGTTKIQIRLSQINTQGLMGSPYHVYDVDINPDWKGVQLVKGTVPVIYFCMFQKGKINIAFVANEKLLAQKEITIIDTARKVKAVSDTKLYDTGLPADDPELPNGDREVSPSDDSPPLP